MEQSVQSLAQEVEKQAQEILNLQLMLLMAQSRQQQQQQIPAVDPGVRFVPMGPAEGTGGMSGPSGILRWSGGGPATAPAPWDYTIDGTSFSVTECVYMRGPMTVTAADPTAITLSGDTVYVAAKITLSSGAVELTQAATKAGVIDATWPSDGRYLKRLLYLVERADSESPYLVTWDYRNHPDPDTVPVAPSSPTVLHSGGSGESTGTADTTTWTAGNADGKGITIWNTMRLKDDTTAGKIYAFMRSLTFDMNGKLQAVSAETKVEISDSVTHSSQHPTT